MKGVLKRGWEVVLQDSHKEIMTKGNIEK